MSIRAVVTRGYGNGTYNGTIAEVVLRGYTIGGAVDPVDPNPPQREPVSGGAGSWPSRQDYRDKRKEKAILDDDEEVMSIIKSALPEILKYLRR